MEFPGILLTTWFVSMQLFLFTSVSSSRLVGNEVDRLSLLAFKAEISNDTMGTLSSWNASLHFCQWPGITCGRRHKRVTVLDLQSSRLVGSLSPHIGNLSFLKELNLPNNSFSDTIPPEIGRLFRLQQLRLEKNSFSGGIPFNISRCFNLQYLGLYETDLSGELPIEIGSLSKLQVLLLGRNRFSGKISSSFGNLSSLQVLSAALNHLQGGIPNSLGQLKSLTFISLGSNYLTGTIPPSIYNLSSITTISVLLNQLHGTLPPGLGHTIFPNLEAFHFHFNQFTGPIPTTISNASNLAIFGISENRCTGRIPSLVRMSNLFRLEIDANNLGNNWKGDLDFLSSLVNCTNLKRLDIRSNNFGGVLPESVSNLSIKKLSGEIPQSLGSCTSLTTLSLRENLLHGTIPKSLSSLRGIEDFDLSRNNLSAVIPNYLGSFPFLQNLNLSFNDFQGVFKNASAVSVVGNTRLCGGIPQLRLPKCISKQSKRRLSPKLNLIISVSCGVVGLVLVLLLVLLYRSRKARALKSPSGSSLGVSLLKLSYGDLLKATDGFSASNLIGAGSFGSVYKGVLNQHEERNVAVKVLNLQTSRASKSFISECEALKSIRHQNLVKLLIACSSIDFQGNDFKALVYEFMVNGSLDEWLHISTQGVDRPTNLPKNLNLTQRVNIAIDVACALDYLHNHSHMPIVHCDIKPSNILLDSDMTACVGDFGLARYFRDASCLSPLHESSSSVIKGSIGYTPPEYGMGSEVATYGDVYSYEILLLEMLTGKRPTDEMFKDGMDLHNSVSVALPRCAEEICDPLLVQIEERNISTNPRSNRGNNTPNDQRKRVVECLTSIARVGVACSVAMPRERKDMNNVVAELSLIRDVLTGIRMPSERL